MFSQCTRFLFEKAHSTNTMSGIDFFVVERKIVKNPKKTDVQDHFLIKSVRCRHSTGWTLTAVYVISRTFMFMFLINIFV